MVAKTTWSFWVACAALYLGGLALLWPTLSYGPVSLDDVSLLREHAGKPLLAIFGSDHFGHLRPGKNLVFRWLSADQERIASFRALVLFTTLLSGLVVQRVAANLIGNRWLVLGGVACWLFHPCTASTVAWLSASNYVFALFFSLAYVMLAARRPRPRLAGVLFELLAHLCLVVAALFLELAVVAPLALWTYRRAVQTGDAERRGGRRLAALGAVSAAMVVALHVAVRTADVAYRTAEHPRGLLALSSARYLLKNLALWLLPSRYFGVLLTDDPAQELWWSIASWLLVLALLVGAVWLWRSDRASRFSLIWAAAFLVPMINLVPLGNTPVAVHYLYIPGVGLALLMCRSAERAMQSPRVPSRLKWAPAIAALVLMLTWLFEAPSAVVAWADSQLLYEKTLVNYPSNVEVRANLAASYLEHDQFEQADALLEESLRIAPDDPAIVGNRFELLWSTQRTDEALAFLAKHPSLNSPDYQYRRGRLLEAAGRPDQAIQAYATAAKQAADPELRFTAGYRHATVLVGMARHRDARQIIEAMLSDFPGDERLLVTHRLLVQEEVSGEH